MRDPSSRRRLQQNVDVAARRKCRGGQRPATLWGVGTYGGRRVGHVATCAARYKTQSGSGLKNQCTSGRRMRSVIVVIVAVAGAGMYSCDLWLQVAGRCSVNLAVLLLQLMSV